MESSCGAGELTRLGVGLRDDVGRPADLTGPSGVAALECLVDRFLQCKTLLELVGAALTLSRGVALLLSSTAGGGERTDQPHRYHWVQVHGLPPAKES